MIQLPFYENVRPTHFMFSASLFNPCDQWTRGCDRVANVQNVHNERNWNDTNSGQMVLAMCDFNSCYFVLTPTAINRACINGNCFWCYGGKRGDEQYSVVAAEM
jgi:hypothetical protein